ncbi:hypothetical protein MANES_10G087466v8 [Manihot esculenta]|uniref:Uncharacterized protein n=1 Tax=Manihot esculenta TaxID=3983 RepID=A0ACB7H1U7_MANES|nr:hypothetical protein MANES_10G087466v8 [Manihot esculenta]
MFYYSAHWASSSPLSPNPQISANAKILNILHCALDITEYNLVSGFESAKEVWNKLEGTNQINESKANLLVRDFELFEMKSCETIAEISTRFTDLVNLLKALEKSFEEAELVKNILRSLSKTCEVKTTVIFDIKVFTKYTYDELIGSLIVHEMGITLKSEKLTDGKKKSITLKIDTSESSSLSSDEEEMAILARKFRRAFRKGGNKYKIFVKKYGPKDDSQTHLHKNSKEHATNESSNDDSKENNEVKLRCMALEEEAVESSKVENIEVIESELPNIEELELIFAKVYDEYKTYKRKYTSLKLENISLRSENIFLSMRKCKGKENMGTKSRCSRHMTGDKTFFSQLIMKLEGFVRFRDKSRAQIIGNGMIGLKLCIENVALVQNLKYNLLSVSQLCDIRFKIFSKKKESEKIMDEQNVKIQNDHHGETSNDRDQKNDIIDSLNQKMMTGNQLRKYFDNVAFILKLKPKSYKEAQNDES